MARPKEFDQQKVLQKAMEVFWSKGYESASMQDLVNHMGINRQSIYDTYGGKHALFLSALDQYQKENSERFYQILNGSGTPIENIRNLFATLIEHCTSDRDRKGCLLANSAVELSPHCPKTHKRVMDTFQEIEMGFYQTLEKARARGEIDDHKDLHALARFLLNAMQGLMVMAKVKPDKKILVDITETTLSAL